MLLVDIAAAENLDHLLAQAVGCLLYTSWCRGYYVDTVGKYEGAIKEYIQNQLQEDIMNDQISLKEFVDPFTGEPVKQGK